jgi:flagellar hook-length control protein FliK
MIWEWALDAPSKEESMTPNPMVAMAAPAPDTRYAPREMPRVGGRNEGRSFEERLNQAQAKSKPASTSKGVAETKPQDKPEVPAESSTESSPKGEVSTEDMVAKTPEEPAAAQAQPVIVPAAPVSELASVAVMTAAIPAPQTPVAEVPEEAVPTPAQAVVQGAVAEGAEAADPALTAAIVKALAPQGKQDALTKTEEATKSAEDAEEAEAAEVAEPAKPAVPVKPVARQAVPSSLDGLRAEKGLMSLRESLDGAPRTEMTPAPAKNESRPIPASLDEVTASVVEEAAPATASVKPWEIAEPVRVAAEVSGPKTESATIKAEPVPVKEAIRQTFVQVQKTPDRPAELKLQLNPEHLGRMEVRVQAHEGAVSAVIRVEHAGVRDLVENQLAALRTSLAEQGIKIDRLEVSVSQQGPRDQQAAAGFEFGRQAFGQEGQPDPSGQQNQGQTRHTGWEAWAAGESEDPLVPEAIAASGFDAQA